MASIVYQTPGVYIEEVLNGARPIQAVGTRTAGFVGVAPISTLYTNEAVPVNNWAEFLRRFAPSLEERQAALEAHRKSTGEVEESLSAYDKKKRKELEAAVALGDGAEKKSTHLSLAVYGFFLNGGSRCYVVNVGLDEPSTTAGETRTAATELADTATKLADNAAKLARSATELAKGTGETARIAGQLADTATELATTVGQPAAELAKAATELAKIAQPKMTPKELRATATSLETTSDKLKKTAGKLKTSTPALERATTELAKKADQTAAKATELAQTIGKPATDKATPAIALATTATDLAKSAAELARSATELAKGKPRPISKGSAPGTPVGLDVLKEIDEVAIVAAPGYVDEDSYSFISSHCADMKDRVAILDGPEDMDDPDTTKQLSGEDLLPASREAAKWIKPNKSDRGYITLYVPWIEVSNPSYASSDREPKTIFVPPSGHIAGIWARSDATRGVHKAPANETVLGALGLKKQITHEEQGQLNYHGVNVIRFFPNEGFLVWGARTLSKEPSFRYLNVRRLFNMIEESIAESTRWIVFEPNDRPLWKAIRRDVTAFLMGFWRDGALMGRTPEEAFYVKCDEETNPIESIREGKVVIEVGLAPVLPAEFVIFRISQYEAGTEVELQS